MEAELYGNQKAFVEKTQLTDALSVLENFHDKNRPSDASMLMFWSQVVILPAYIRKHPPPRLIYSVQELNPDSMMWQSTVPNMNGDIRYATSFVPFKLLSTLFDAVGQEQLNSYLDTIQNLLYVEPGLMNVANVFLISALFLGMLNRFLLILMIQQ